MGGNGSGRRTTIQTTDACQAWRVWSLGVTASHTAVVIAGRRVEVASTSCALGGRRPWLLCPHCGRRVGIVYRAHRLGCRTCLPLAYPCQRERPSDRAARAAVTLRRRLGGTGALWEPVPPRPQGMRRHTYRTLVAKLFRAEKWALTGIRGWLRERR